MRRERVSAIERAANRPPGSVASMSDESAPPEPEQETGPGTWSLLVRLVSGGIGEGIDRLTEVARELDAMATEPDPGPMLVKADPNVMAVVGWMSELPSLLRSAGASTQKMLYPFTRTAGVVVDTAAYVAEATGIAPFVAGLTEPARTALAQERDRLTNVGTAEYARGRVLAVFAFEQSVGGVVDLVSDSPELAELVREQTIGITGSAVKEVRETGASADALTEGVVRRILRRPARTLPPRVVEEP
jgi:hypothetical protein